MADAEVFVPRVRIDRDSPTPLYEQISNPIETAILSGELAPGSLIEDEVSMAGRLRVARPTARRALQELVAKGLVSRQRGVGTRVNPRYVHRAMELSSLYEDLLRAGFAPTTKVLTYEVREATQEEGETMELPAGSVVLAITRLRFADQQPLALMRNRLPVDIAPTWEELNASGLYDCLRSKGIEIVTATQEVGAREVSADEGELLEELPGAPVLTMRRIGRSSSGRVVELGEHVYRPSLYSFKFSLFAQ